MPKLPYTNIPLYTNTIVKDTYEKNAISVVEKEGKIAPPSTTSLPSMTMAVRVGPGQNQDPENSYSFPLRM